MSKYWHKINQGDIACIVAPSFGLKIGANISSILKKTIEIVEGYGLKAFIHDAIVVPGKHSLFDDVHFRFANSDEVKANLLIEAFTNSSCDVVWAFKGGYGTNRILKYLSKVSEPDNVKPFIGFSDMTILHSYINNIWNWPTIHFGTPGSFQELMQRDDTKKSLQNILFGRQTQVSFKLESFNINLERDDTVIKGVTTGGTMFLFDKLLGTIYSPELRDRIIIIEDIDTSLVNIDAFLQKIILMPSYEKIKALVVGHFPPTEDQSIFYKIFEDFTEYSYIPVFHLDPNNTIGHGNVNNALPLGTEGVIEMVDSFYQLSVNSGMMSFDSQNEL